MAAQEEQKKDDVVQFDLSTKLTLDMIEAKDGGFVVSKSKSKPTAGSRIFLRADYNVPLDNDCKITDTTRITATLPTIQKLLDFKPTRLIITSHLGRPKGNIKPKLSLQPVVDKLKELLKIEVVLLKDWFKEDLNERIAKAPAGAIVVLENCRFYIEEEGKGVDNDGNKHKAKEAEVKRFRDILTSIADLYINDAFGTCHRGHSSMVGCNVSLRAAGFLVKKELTYFDKALAKPTSPYLAILGGAKVSDKIKVIESLLDRVNEMIIAGGMCFTFLKVINKMPIGNSLYDEEGSKIVESLIAKAKKNGVNIILPVDFVCCDGFSNDGKIMSAALDKGIPDGFMGLDIGPKSIALVTDAVLRAKTVVFNGPPGVFEFSNFQNGTKSLVEALAKTTEKNGCVTIVGGGDSASATNKFGCGDKVSHISTGGGASLELLEGKVLPGLAFLSEISEYS